MISTSVMQNYHKTYISCPVSVDLDFFKECVKLVSKLGSRPLYWVRGETYNEKPLVDSNAFLLILPDNQFGSHLKTLPIGCKKELKRACVLGKPIFLAYKLSTSEEIKIFDAKVTEYTITGLSGTSDAFSTAIFNFETSIFNSEKADLMNNEDDENFFESLDYWTYSVTQEPIRNDALIRDSDSPDKRLLLSL